MSLSSYTDEIRVKVPLFQKSNTYYIYIKYSTESLPICIFMR